MTYQLLEVDEPSPVLAQCRSGKSSFVITVDHAGRRIPRRLIDLGLAAPELVRHIAWDIGALAVAIGVSDALDAPLVAQNYSRLVIDCNRGTHLPSSIPIIAELTDIPGNVGLAEAEVAARRAEILVPYHESIRTLLDERKSAGRPTILVSQHSMTDCFKGSRRGMHAAVLYDRSPSFAQLVLEILRREPGLIVGDNEPYRCSPETDYTITHHALARGLPYVEIEVRQDLIADAEGQIAWADRIAQALREAERVFLSRAP